MHAARKSSVAVAVMLGLAAAPVAQAAGERIAVFTKNQTNPFFHIVRVGAENAAKQMGAQVTQYVPTKPDSIPEQMAQIEDVVVKKPDAIVFTPVDFKAMAPGVQKMNAANIPVVNITDKSAEGKFVAYVGAHDYNLGLETSRALFRAMGGKGNVVLLEGVKGTLTNSERVRGFNDAMKQFPGVRMVAAQPANYQRLNALQVMENLMQAHPQIGGVFAANDAMAIGAIEALEGANRKAFVVGINGTKEAVDAIKSGKMLATGDYSAYLHGCVGTMAAIRALRKQPVPAQIVFAAHVVDKSNYQPLDIEPEKRSCPKWEEVVK